MSRIVVMNHVTLDGVMQGPGRADEDTRGGFSHGGWSRRSTLPEDAVVKAMSDSMAAGGSLAGWLFGRRTYEDLLGYWNQQPDSSFGPNLNEAPKYVASTTLAEPLPWPNSTLLRGDIADAVRTLKTQTDGVLAIMGSGQLIGSFMAARRHLPDLQRGLRRQLG
jgi:dihydrofolate reductase